MESAPWRKLYLRTTAAFSDFHVPALHIEGNGGRNAVVFHGNKRYTFFNNESSEQGSRRRKELLAWVL